MTRKLSQKTLAVLCVVWLLFMIAPLFAMSAYVYPGHDDFPNARRVLDAWAQTGSLLEVLKAGWQQTMLDYMQWQGTFAAMFLCTLQPMIFSTELSWISPVVTLLLLTLSAAYAAVQLSRLLKTNGYTALVLFTLLMTALIFAAPGISELLYWHASIQYTFSIIVMLLIAGLLMKLYQPMKTPARIIRTVLLAVLCFLLGGLPYTHALGGAVAMGLAMVWFIRRRSAAMWAGIAGFAAIAVSLIIVIIAPGNAIRQVSVGGSMNPVKAIIYSIEAALSGAGSWFGPEWIGIALIAVPVVWEPAKKAGVRFANPAWFSFFTFGVLAACYVPPIFATGVEGYQLPRIEGSLYMLFSFLAFLNLLYWACWAAQKSTQGLRFSIRTGTALACAVMIFWGAFSTGAAFATPTLAAWRSLITGEAAQFRQEMRQREQAILEAENREEAKAAVQTLNAQPIIFPLDMLIYQTRTGLPKQMHRFFDLQRLTQQYGAGRIPAEEWEKLENWGNQ